MKLTSILAASYHDAVLRDNIYSNVLVFVVSGIGEDNVVIRQRVTGHIFGLAHRVQKLITQSSAPLIYRP